MRINFFAAGCSSIPADCSRNTNGTRAAVHDGHFGGADIDKGIIDSQGPPWLTADAPLSTPLCSPRPRLVESVVSPTFSARAGISATGETSVRRNTMPLSIGAGLSVRNTFSPVCNPTPVALIGLRNVLCLIMLMPCVSFQLAFPVRPKTLSASKSPVKIAVIPPKRSIILIAF